MNEYRTTSGSGDPYPPPGQGWTLAGCTTDGDQHFWFWTRSRVQGVSRSREEIVVDSVQRIARVLEAISTASTDGGRLERVVSALEKIGNWSEAKRTLAQAKAQSYFHDQ